MARNTRRDFLKLTGVGGTALVAGCLGDDDDGDDTGTDDDDDIGVDDSDDGDDSAGLDDFPDQDFEIIVPYGPGGDFDYFAQVAAQHLPDFTPDGISATKTNVEGAGGVIGVTQVYNAEPDGYTHLSTLTDGLLRQQMVEDVDFDISEMTMFARFLQNRYVAVAGAHTDIETWDQAVDAMAAGDVTLGAQGYFTGAAVGPTTVGSITGDYPPENVVDNVVVYGGTGEVIAAIESGDVDLFLNGVLSTMQYFESDAIVPIAAFYDDGEEDIIPDEVPEDIIMGPEMDHGEEILSVLAVLRTFSGPPDIPDERVDVVRGYYEDVLTDDDVIAEVEDTGRRIDFMHGDELEAEVEALAEIWEEHRDVLELLAEAGG